MKELYAALLKAKENISPPVKNKKAVYGRYADLEAVLEAVERPLADQGLVIVQTGAIRDGRAVLQTRLAHTESGQELVSEIPLVAKNDSDPQQLGGSITYARRYGIGAILSIVADDDDDGNTSSDKERDGSPKKKAPKQDKGVSQKQIEETMAVEQNITPKQVDAIFKEYGRAGFEDKEVIPEIKKLLDRDFGQVAELTEAEAFTAVGHARKVKSGDTERLTT